MQRGICILIIFSIFLQACKDDKLLPNLPPETSIFIESINLSGENRLNSVVRLSWNGEDQDGYVVGYELSFDEATWSLVEVQDSIFRFSLPAESDTFDLDFFVRAKDNAGEVDPTPAFLRIPIRNTPPVARFDTLRPLPDTAFVLFSTIWQVTDFDGDNTLEKIQLKFNDGPWYDIDPGVSLATFVPNDPRLIGSQNFSVSIGQNRQTSFEVEGLKSGDLNTIYLKAADVTGAESEIDTSNAFFLKPQSGDLLVIDAYGCNRANSTPDDIYFPILQEVYPTFDYFNLCDNIPAFWDPTFGVFLELYDKVFWYGDGSFPGTATLLLMESASSQLQLYLNNGGKLFASLPFPNSFSDPATGNLSLILGFAPIDSFSTSPGQARIPTNSLAIPQGSFAGLVDTLKSSTFKTGADPFYPKNPADNMFTVELQKTGGWVGPNVIASTTRYSNGEVNQVFFSSELHTFNGDPPALKGFIDYVLNNAFDW